MVNIFIKYGPLLTQKLTIKTTLDLQTVKNTFCHKRIQKFAGTTQ